MPSFIKIGIFFSKRVVFLDGSGDHTPSWAVTGAIVLLGVLFYPAFHARALQAVRHGSILAFEGVAVDPAYRAYMTYALSNRAKETITTAQDAVPEGGPLLAWTPLALHLDYARNPIMDVEPAGLANPWHNAVSYSNASEVQRYLSAIGVKYMIWKYHSFAFGSKDDLLRLAASSYDWLHIVGIKTLQFTNTLNHLVTSSDILYNDGSIVVARLPRMDRTETAENR